MMLLQDELYRLKTVTAEAATDDLQTLLSEIARKTLNAVVITNPHEEIVWVNDSFCRNTGYLLEDVIEKKASEVLHGPNTDRSMQDYISARIRKRKSFKCEILRYTKYGQTFWVEVEGQPIFNEYNELTHYFQIETDISSKKKVFEKLVRKENEIRSFARQLNQVLEEERSRIAREIHDEFGQQLSGLKMSISSLGLRSSEGDYHAVHQRIKEILADTDQAIQSMRKFATELRPAILDTLGLFPSVEWLVNDFKKKTQLSIFFTITGEAQVIDKEIAICFFRVCQEALTNIIKHAYAGKVIVALKAGKNSLSLQIADNGKGMLEDKLNDPFSMGLLGMRERANLIGGKLSVKSSPGRGTTIDLMANVTAEKNIDRGRPPIGSEGT